MKKSIQATIPVTFEHQVYFDRKVFNPGNSLLRDLLGGEQGSSRRKILMLVDANLTRFRRRLMQEMAAYFEMDPRFDLVCAPVPIDGGEQIKNSDRVVKNLYGLIERHGLCRHSYVMAVGGGTLLDVAGYVAATAHRGLRLIRIPTTVLAQADAGVGVKNGINFNGKKNFIGTFAPPYAVINDSEMLSSLSAHDRRSGYIEAVKIALIRDRIFFEWIVNHVTGLLKPDADLVEKLVYLCAKRHLQHIAECGDPFEKGTARPLDFGHWAAHKIEQLSEFSIGHGEAVAMGIALDSTYSMLMGYLDKKSCDRIIGLLEDLGFELLCEPAIEKDFHGRPLLLEGLAEFQEHIGGPLNLTLLKGIGESLEVQSIDEDRMMDAIALLQLRKKQFNPADLLRQKVAA